MLSEIAHQAQEKAARTAQDAVLGLGAAILLFVGFGFLTVALWIFLATVANSLVAAVTIGAAYFGVGLILISVISARRRARKRRARERAALAAARARAPVHSTLNDVILTFVSAMRAGRNSRRG